MHFLHHVNKYALREKYVYKIYMCACPTELAHSKEITISFKQMPVTVAVIWKEIYSSSP
jgi:hypothetical protein